MANDPDFIRSAIAAAAFLVAALAFVLGEVRARRTRRTQAERNVVKLDWAWTAPAEITMTNAGPDEMRRVLVLLTSKYVRTEAQAKRLRRGETLIVPVPHLAES